VNLRVPPGWVVTAALAGACCSFACSREDIELVGRAHAPASLDASFADVAQPPVDAQPFDAQPFDAQPVDAPDAQPMDARVAADAAACDMQTGAASMKRLEILVLLENSSSMAFGPGLSGDSTTCLLFGEKCGPGDAGLALTRWDLAVLELKKFVRDPRSNGIAVALKYFGTDCDPNTYATPDVPFGTLPEQAATIESSLDSTSAVALTATRPALEGALKFLHARVQPPNDKAHTVIAVITDGKPSLFECSDNTFESVSRIAATGIAADPPIPTYAFAVTSELNLDEIAQAGGTGQTIQADLAQPGALSQALSELRDRETNTLPCHE
jgi:hypothetical protein